MRFTFAAVVVCSAERGAPLTLGELEGEEEVSSEMVGGTLTIGIVLYSWIRLWGRDESRRRSI